MKPRLIPWLLVLLLAGCAPLGSPGGRVVLLVLVPAAIVAVALWVLRRRDRGRHRGRGPRYPDYDDRE